MGQIGLSLDDFCALTIEEFEAVYQSWAERREDDNRERWERMRLLASISIQPHVRKRIVPRQLLPLPWDNHKEATAPAAPSLTPQERLARFQRLATLS